MSEALTLNGKQVIGLSLVLRDAECPKSAFCERAQVHQDHHQRTTPPPPVSE